MKIKLIYTTTNSNKIADNIAEILLQENQSVCVQIIPNIQSTYKWKDKLEKSSEILLILKPCRKKYIIAKILSFNIIITKYQRLL